MNAINIKDILAQLQRDYRFEKDTEDDDYLVFIGLQNSPSRVWIDKDNNFVVDYLNNMGLTLHVAPNHSVNLAQSDYLEEIRYVLLDHPDYVPDLPSMLDHPDIRLVDQGNGSYSVIVRCQNYSSVIKIIGHKISVTYCDDYHLPLPDLKPNTFSIVAVGLKQLLTDCLLAHPLL
jgi:hypothetical protein